MSEPTSVIYVDADACPVKEEVYRVARRLGLEVRVVANAFIRTPADRTIRFIQVDAGPDAADDWIAERAGVGDIVVTADIPLAARALERGAQVVSPVGRPFTRDMIGEALASRAVMEHLRSFGGVASGPPPFEARDRSRFLGALDTAAVRALRARSAPG